MKAFIVYPDYTILDNQTYVQLFGRLENGQSFATLNKLDPYFFIEESDLRKISLLLKNFKTEKTQFVNFAGKKVVKISSSLHTELNKLIHVIHKKDINTFESDIKPHFRFLIDNNLLGTINIDGEYETAGIDGKVDRVFKEPKISSAEFKPKLKILSIDIESDKHSGKLFCIGLYSENYKKNFMITDKKLENVISCRNEAECLEKFKAELIKFDPDIITGWNIIDFDLVCLQELFKKHKIKFDLGRTNDSARLRIESGFFRASSADLPGRQVLDALNLIKDPFIQEAPSIKHAEYDTFGLEDVSQAILGTGKLIKGKKRHDDIEKLFKSSKKEDIQALADYNLMDCQLVYDILEKTKLIDLSVERSTLTGMPLDRVTSSIANFDSLYIREARARGIVSPTTRYREKEERIKGGYVYSSKPGIYHNVLIFDFKSLYPSIIKTFNIDPASYLENKGKEKDVIESPNKAYFKNQEGILPVIIEKLHQAREKAKKEKREFSSYAIKIIMNSFFGVLASPNCRYFDLKMANAITHFGQMIIKLTAEQIEKQGYKVIYIDTDSCFIETSLNKEKANKAAVEIQEYINKFYQDYAKKKYNRKSFLEFEFEKQYLSLMIPQIRMKGKEGEEVVAAKKRYAGLVEKDGKEEIEITGLEAIRGDWTEAAQEFQRELLNKVFHKEEITYFIKSYIKKINSGVFDSKLIYRKSIRKELHEYTKTTPPHVKAARLLDTLESNVIEYYITTSGPEPIQKHKHKIDYEHYIEKQIKPIANQILVLFNKNFDEIVKGSKQATLF